ncbi:hypothetical protein [Pseudoalteromonas denitrificans]|uniref:Phospholipase_D-nuclease N-terminal n=1 Tax=Pseudoalteromonas denitrificans DSM 6059 TaxID=1123010 RepID=A0A1I1GKF7_9GAMM|nr:hypothetical protein [Pseudoalteromonas denitrificans]SFC11762.1 hypothetical protein SAMN02745724_00922 [Pseudoalteromonas denitrificans DSM 6059]
MELNYWHIFFAVVALMNLFVSIYLTKRDDLETFQKVAQIILVWLIPVAAAIGFWLFHRSQDVQLSPSKLFGGGVNNNTNITGTGD